MRRPARKSPGLTVSRRVGSLALLPSGPDAVRGSCCTGPGLIPAGPSFPVNRTPAGAAGGESGIRTHGTLLTYTRFPSVRLKPLGHLSVLRTKLKIENYKLKMCIKTRRIFNFQFFIFNFRTFSARYGGEGGIRTLDTREGITVFETAAFNRSATSPFDRAGAAGGRTPGAWPASAPP
jgi:hypothetical protein